MLLGHAHALDHRVEQVTAEILEMPSLKRNRGKRSKILEMPSLKRNRGKSSYRSRHTPRIRLRRPRLSSRVSGFVDAESS